MVIIMIVTEKRTYNGLPDLMTRVACDEMTRMDDDIAECKVVYMPQVKLPFSQLNFMMSYYNSDDGSLYISLRLKSETLFSD